MAIFNSKLLNHQRVYPSISQYYLIIIPLSFLYTILNHRLFHVSHNKRVIHSYRSSVLWVNSGAAVGRISSWRLRLKISSTCGRCASCDRISFFGGKSGNDILAIWEHGGYTRFIIHIYICICTMYIHMYYVYTYIHGDLLSVYTYMFLIVYRYIGIDWSIRYVWR